MNKKSRIVGVRLPIAHFEAIESSGLTISEFIKQAVELKLANRHLDHLAGGSQ